MSVIDLFKSFIGPWWLTVIGIGVIIWMIIFVTIGIVKDYRDWKRRPRRVKSKRKKGK